MEAALAVGSCDTDAGNPADHGWRRGGDKRKIPTEPATPYTEDKLFDRHSVDGSVFIVQSVYHGMVWRWLQGPLGGFYRGSGRFVHAGAAVPGCGILDGSGRGVGEFYG